MPLDSNLVLSQHFENREHQLKRLFAVHPGTAGGRQSLDPLTLMLDPQFCGSDLGGDASEFSLPISRHVQ